MKKMILSALLALSVNMAMAQGDVLQTATMKRDLTAKVNEQVYFPETVPPGNYSGITWLGGSLYAVVSDKSKRDGFFIFHINIDPDTGQISHAYSNEFRGEDYACRDNEGIAFVAQDSTIFISGETGNRMVIVQDVSSPCPTVSGSRDQTSASSLSLTILSHAGFGLSVRACCLWTERHAPRRTRSRTIYAFSVLTRTCSL